MLKLLEGEVQQQGHAKIGLGVDDPRARVLYLRLGYADTGLTYIDRYTWIDKHHVEHQVADRCQWLEKDL